MSGDHAVIAFALAVAVAFGWTAAALVMRWSYWRAVRQESANANARDGATMIVWLNGCRKFEGNLDQIAWALKRDGKVKGLTYTGQVSIAFRPAGRL